MCFYGSRCSSYSIRTWKICCALRCNKICSLGVNESRFNPVGRRSPAQHLNVGYLLVPCRPPRRHIELAVSRDDDALKSFVTSLISSREARQRARAVVIAAYVRVCNNECSSGSVTSSSSSSSFPSVWNSSPADIRLCESVSTFKRHLQAHLFRLT